MENAADKILFLRDYLTRLDTLAGEFTKQIEAIGSKHKIEGGYIEYAYVQHFHHEIMGLSGLFQYLLNNKQNQRYVFFAVRGSIEILLHLEYVLRLAKEDSKEVLKLISIDVAQSAAAINAAATPDPTHAIHEALAKIHLVNKVLGTGFDLEKIKSNTGPFPNMRQLCNDSLLNIKDSKGGDMYHIYSLYSESNHLRLSSQHAVGGDIDVLTCWALEYFIEIYMKFYEQLLKTGHFSDNCTQKLSQIKTSLGLSW
jgi:hypothetical protein